MPAYTSGMDQTPANDHAESHAAHVASTPKNPARKGSWGGIIGIFLIMLVIVMGAFYSWGERMAMEEARNASASE